MGLFNDIIERKADGSSTKVNYDILREGIKRTFYIAT